MIFQSTLLWNRAYRCAPQCSGYGCLRGTGILGSTGRQVLCGFLGAADHRRL